MKLGRILIRILAGIGFLVILAVLTGGYAFYNWLNRPYVPPKAPDSMVLELDFTNPVVEQRRQSMTYGLASLLKTKEEIVLMDIVRALDRAKDDARVKGVIARIGPETPSLVHIQEIRAALVRFREKGKFSFVFASSYGSFGLGNRAYYLASAFENIWLQPVGSVGLTGLGIEAPFGKTALGNIGITSDFLRRDEYKSVMENVTRDSFSPSVRANMESMLKNMSEQLVTDIATSRNITPAKARDWMAKGPYTAEEALKEGIVTRIGYKNEMYELAKVMATDPAKDEQRAVSPSRVPPSTYLAFGHALPKAKATVAYIDGTGVIADMPSGGPSLASEQIIDTDEIAQAFIDAANDSSVAAILFRVNSPGGSPEASETIRNAVVRAKKAKKPVFVSMGDVAASGGYWIAMNADHIVAAPASVTGSIGVVAGKFVIEGLSRKIGLHWDRLATADNAMMWSSMRGFNDYERERVNALLDSTYTAFTANVSEARKIPAEKIADVAKGRVFTGHQALNVGLVDELGGLHTAITAVKKRLNLEPTDLITLKTFPSPETPVQLVLKILRSLGVELAMARQGLGFLHQTREIVAPVWGALNPSEPVGARLPQPYLLITR